MPLPTRHLQCCGLNYLKKRLILRFSKMKQGEKQAQEWIYSSASNYQELESIIEVKRLTQRLITYS